MQYKGFLGERKDMLQTRSGGILLMVLHVMQQSVKWCMEEGSRKGRLKVHLF